MWQRAYCNGIRFLQQYLVNLPQIILIQFASFGLQPQPRHEKVVTRLGKIASRGKKQLLRIQYVYLCSNPHIPAKPGRVQLALAGYHSLLQCFHLGHAIGDIQILLAYQQHTIAARIVQILVHPFLISQRFTYARLYREPLKQGNVKLKPYLLGSQVDPSAGNRTPTPFWSLYIATRSSVG